MKDRSAEETRKRAVLSALNSSRLSGADPEVLKEIAAKEGVEWRNPDEGPEARRPAE